ncbi:hypothetical protein EOL70_05190 [Leucothrix sargassi]|nr:hypothetical protein EOL70_05190 [Leucothrix sargassi]
MRTNLTLLGSVVLFTSVGLTACDSATATNDKTSSEATKTVVEEVKKAAEAAPAAVKENVDKMVEAAPAVKDAVVAKAEEAKAGMEKMVEAAPAVKDAVVAKAEEAKAGMEKMVEAAPAVKDAVVAKAEEAKAGMDKMVEAAPEVKDAVVAKATEAKEAVVAMAATAPAMKDAVVAKATEAKEEMTEVAAENTAEAEAAAKALADAEATYKEGTHYFEIFPTMQTDAVGGKIEVVELMWLACPHCFALEPTMKEYKRNLPDYIDFKQVPAMLNPRWSADAKTFYIAELLDPKGELKLIDKLFNAIHVQKRKRMASPDVVKQFIMQQGVSEADYDNAANSMALTAKLNRARQVSADSQANSVPSIIINGKYRTSPYAAGNEKKLLEIIDMLTKRELDKK